MRRTTSNVSLRQDTDWWQGSLMEGQIGHRVADDESIAGPAPRSGKRWASRAPSGVESEARVRSPSSRPEVLERMFEEGRVPARESAGPVSRCTTCGPRPRSASRLRDRRITARVTARRSCHTLIGAVRKATGHRARSRLDDDQHRHRHDETTLNELGGCFGCVSRPDIRRCGGAGPRLPDSCQSRSPCVGSAHQRVSVVPQVRRSAAGVKVT